MRSLRKLKKNLLLFLVGIGLLLAGGRIEDFNFININ